MPIIVKPQPQFLALTETEIEAALRDPDPANPIAGELARLIEAYTANFAAHVQQLGHIPPAILHVKPGSAIEAVAMRLTTAQISEALLDRENEEPKLRVFHACPDCKQIHRTQEDYPGWFFCTQCQRPIFWRDVKAVATQKEPSS